jgi:glycine hydroxymethyltransferase
MRIVIGSDHGGYEIKEVIKQELIKRGIDIKDFGCDDKTTSVDYSDFAEEVASEVSLGKAEQGVLVCTTGIGMSIAANKFPRVRAALCNSHEMAEMARRHNNANILALSGKQLSPEQAVEILDTWLINEFEEDTERHVRRVEKFQDNAERVNEISAIFDVDRETFDAIQNEVDREQDMVNLIASENHCSLAVRQAQGSIMTNKYAEGYPGKRWYNGCDYVDVVERLAIDRAKELFKADHANVQPHCGSAANMAVYFSVLEPGDTIMAMSLAHGGHLTHGNPVNFSGRLFNFVSYGVNKETEQLDFDEMMKMAAESKPKLIVAGGSAYSRILDFEKFRAVADSVGAMLMVDMAHIAGLVAGGAHPNPTEYADFVTTTTHKTLRGPRSGMVLCREQYAAALDKTVFPGLQGGPQMHTVAAKAVCFLEAAQPAFAEYSKQVVKNAKVMAEVMENEGFRVVSGGTDNHLMLLDLSANGLTGKEAALALDKAGLIVNKNAIPFDTKSPFVTSGIRIGTPAITTRGMKETETETISKMIAGILRDINNEDLQASTKDAVKELCAGFVAP